MDLQMNSYTNTPILSLDNLLSDNNVRFYLIIITFILILMYVFTGLGNFGSNSLGGIELFMWIFFIVLVIINGLNYLYGYNVTAKLKNLFTLEPEVDIVIDTENDPLPMDEVPVPEITFEKQVFHIPDNKYTYEDSKAICNAYGARLATWKEIEDAYEKGGDWCGYGWSDGQMALYPTQYNKWKELQKIKGHEHDCGRPGVNGGYIANPNVRFGINCYGYKPEITPEEAKMMANTPLYPITKKELDFERKVDYWKQKIPEILVAPFNNSNWSIV